MLRATRDGDNSEEEGENSADDRSVDESDMESESEDKLEKMHKKWKKVASRMVNLDKDNMKAIALLALVVIVMLRLSLSTSRTPEQMAVKTSSKSLRSPSKIHTSKEDSEPDSDSTKHHDKLKQVIDYDEEDNQDPTANIASLSQPGGFLANGGGVALMQQPNQLIMPQQNFMQPGMMQQQGYATQQFLLQQQQQQQQQAMYAAQQQQQALMQLQAQKQLEEQLKAQQEAIQKQQQALLQQQQQQQQALLAQQQQMLQQPNSFGAGQFGMMQQGFPGMQQGMQGFPGIQLPGSTASFPAQMGGQTSMQTGILPQMGGQSGSTGSNGMGFGDTSGAMLPGITGNSGAMLPGMAAQSDTMLPGTMDISGGLPAGMIGASGLSGGLTDTFGSTDSLASLPKSDDALASPGDATRPSDADMAQVADQIPLRGLSNFRDSWAPYSKSDVPIYFHIPKSGGSSIKDVVGSCHRMVMASEFGITDGHDKDTEVAIVYPKVPGGTGSEDRSPFVNVDTTTVAGIDRAAKMGFADSGLAGCVITPFLYESNNLFTPTAQGRLFAVFREPVDRAVSMFYYLQVATWGKSQQ